MRTEDGPFIVPGNVYRSSCVRGGRPGCAPCAAPRPLWTASQLNGMEFLRLGVCFLRSQLGYWNSTPRAFESGRDWRRGVRYDDGEGKSWQSIPLSWTQAFEAEINGCAAVSCGASQRTSTPLAFVAGSCGDKTRASSRLAVNALLRAGADPTRPASRNEPAREASVSTERGTYVVARALYAENKEIAKELLSALFGVGSFAKSNLVLPDSQQAYAVVADAVDVRANSASWRRRVSDGRLGCVGVEGL